MPRKSWPFMAFFNFGLQNNDDYFFYHKKKSKIFEVGTPHLTMQAKSRVIIVKRFNVTFLIYSVLFF